ncbi:MAG: AAA family ATPase [Lachnospiraceae bacterium]|nr:AAA family ATPase [Lachnospiraceae bacterium]
MGVYLNSRKPYLLFQEEASSAYFVDKTDILKELVPLVELKENKVEKSGEERGKGHKYVCITRPRRFGKTVMANMISAYFGKGIDSRETFRGLKASSFDWFENHLNQHNVIHVMCNELPDECTTYAQYIARIKRRLLNDLIREFPDANIDRKDPLWDAFNSIIEFGNGEKFIFVLDEWDYIFHRKFITDSDKAAYIDFLSNLLKDQPYVELVYMTGILPIAKYSSGSELNMFYEYTMATREKYSEYFGFTDAEVDQLYQRYLKNVQEPNVTREGLEHWYDGYQTVSGKRLYNPRSVVGALNDNQLGSYWTSSGPYDEIYYYVENDVAQVRDDIALMVSGTPVLAKVQEYAATSMKLTTRDEIFSAMIVYGFLSYKNGYVSIPNKELMDKFADMIQKEPSLGYVHRLAKESGQMLCATKAGDTKKMLEILEYAHNTESPLMSYSNEAELAAIVRLVYLEARDSYRIEREDKAGIGFVDFIFDPRKMDDDCIIIELKVDHSAEEAIQQIKERDYALKFQGKLGEKPEYTGRILAVGIAYYKEDKKHNCKIEVLREKE